MASGGRFPNCLSGIQALKHSGLWRQRDAAHSEWSASDLRSQQMLRQFGHGKLQVPAVMSHIAIVSAELGVFKTVAAHLGVLVVDRVDEEEDDGDGHYCDSHESCYER